MDIKAQARASVKDTKLGHGLGIFSMFSNKIFSIFYFARNSSFPLKPLL